MFAVIDVNLWADGEKTHLELAAPMEVPSMLHILVAQGIVGVSPHALGLTPCLHEPWHWNPLCLPLTWQQEMNNPRLMGAFVRHYTRSFSDASWQCPDAAPLTR